MAVGLAVRIAVLLFDRAPPPQVPVFRRSHDGLVTPFFLHLDREEPLGRWVARIGYHPSAPLELPQGMDQIPGKRLLKTGDTSLFGYRFSFASLRFRIKIWSCLRTALK